jgi:AcrR family transcriptional regulator
MSSQSSRKYQKRLRAQQEAETRQRITEAAMRLHGSVGPARTTIKAVAEEAGVQRATVYRYFPDDEALFAACSGHWYALHPPPDPSAWAAIDDPDERLREALLGLYSWYASDEQMFVNMMRDGPLVPAMAGPWEQAQAAFQVMREALVAGRGERGRRRARVVAALAHALTFSTWHSLVREGGLSDAEAVELMEATVAAAAGRGSGTQAG